MSNSKVSVIIPVYKSEKYLARCLDSVLSQTHKALEIIIVDDGSPDGCPQICDDYALRDERIKVIHKLNGGASSARNAGLEAASGKYVCFVDSDDTVPADGIEKLYSYVCKTGSQFAMGMCGLEGENTVKYKINKLSVIDFEKEPERLLSHLCLSGSYSPYAKIYELAIFKRNGVKYNIELKCSEDALMIRQYMKYCRRICLVPHIVYEYNMHNDNSLSKKGYPDYGLYFAEKMKALEELTAVLPLKEEQRLQFLNQRAVHGLKISVLHYFIHWAEEEPKKAFLKKTVEALSPWLYLTEIDDRFYLASWWMYNSKLLKNGRFDDFYKTVEKEYNQPQFLKRVKRMIKRFAKR